MSIPDFKEEFKTWRDRYTLSQLLTCLWTRQEREKFWNAARSVEMLKTVCFGKPAEVHKLHRTIKKVGSKLYISKKYYNSPSLALHLLRPSALETHFDLHIKSQQERIELLNDCAIELTNYSNQLQMLVSQMKFLQSLSIQLWSWEKSITAQLMESFLTMDLRDHPLLAFPRVKRGRCKKKSNTPEPITKQLYVVGVLISTILRLKKNEIYIMLYIQGNIAITCIWTCARPTNFRMGLSF